MKVCNLSRITPPLRFLFQSIWVAPIAALGFSMVLGLTWADNVPVHTQPLGLDDTRFVFMGTCEQGEKYRLVAYTRTVEGQPTAMYDYEGPAGTGTIRSNTTPRTLAVRVCRKMAEILDDH